MTSKKQSSWPVPLAQRDDGLGHAAREYAKGTETTPDEAAAYGRTLRRMAGRPRRLPWLVAGIGLGVAAAVVVIVVSHHGAGTASQNEVARVHAVPSPAPAAVPAAPLLPTHSPNGYALIRLGAFPSPLPAGRVELIDVAQANLFPDAVASGRAQAGHTEIALAQGNIELHVRPRGPGQDFQVSAGEHRFVVVGTAFTVSRTETQLALSVSEGRVAVWRAAERLTTVEAGGRWAVRLPASSARPSAAHVPSTPAAKLATRDPVRAPAPIPSPSPVARVLTTPEPAVPPALVPAATQPEPPAAQPAVAARRDCGTIAAAGDPRAALSCYQNQVAQGGLAGEAAQYEIARLWRDALRDPARALAAFREQRSRFPGGVLAIEADLSIIELLPRLDRHAEALTESERFLKEHPGGERRGEIHLLRGNIYREALRDLGHAEREYALGSEARGRAGDESRFLRAVCLETLGKNQEARKAYESYLAQPRTAHAADAKKRLERLSP